MSRMRMCAVHALVGVLIADLTEALERFRFIFEMNWDSAAQRVWMIRQELLPHVWVLERIFLCAVYTNRRRGVRGTRST